MAINIKNPETHRLAQRLAEATGTTLTEAVTQALRERLATIESPRDRDALKADVAAIQAFVASLPDIDSRTPEAIIGYDDFGIPR